MQNAFDYTSLSNMVQQYVRDFFDTHSSDKLFYHNLSHTLNVVKASVEIANHYQLTDHDFFIVYSAAWFHDLGYYINSKNHEEDGAKHAAEYLQTLGLDAQTIEAVKGCIMATKMPQQPQNLPEQIVCDADLFHFGTDDFADRNKLMRKEVMATWSKEISKEEWRTETINLLESHTFYTDYCRLLLNEKKAANLQALLMKEDKYKVPVKEKSETNEISVPTTNTADTDTKAKTKKSSRPERGIETMFRISSGNHQRLSDQADSKSQILITVNSIIISVLLSVLLSSLERYPYLSIPAYMLLTVNVVTIIFSILATRPTIPKGTFTQNDIAEKKVNLLFFGNFYRMSLQEYADGMIEMMNDSEFLYGSLIRDVYSQGVVLGRKYRMLRLAYNVFMFGLIIAVLAFVIATLTAKPL